MKVVLIRPPKYMVEGVPDMPIGSPLGMALIASYLIRERHEVSAIDALAEAPQQYQDEDIPVYSNRVPKGYKLITRGLSFSDIAERIPRDTEVIGLSCMFSINWLCDRAFIAYLSSKFPKATIIAGGESITGLAELCLTQARSLTACILGEGEETCAELLNALSNGQPLELVKGIAFRKSDGTVVKTSARERLRKIDDLPFPAWELLPLVNYQKEAVIQGEEPRITLSILATRGCPYKCTFCTSPDMWGTRYFMRKTESVIAEIKYVKQTFGISNFDFFDLTAIIHKKWIISFAKLLVENNLNITWRIPAGTRSEAIDEEVAYWLKKSGCYFITYAPESGSPRMLELIQKKVSLKNMIKSMQAVRKYGILPNVSIILALPDETHIDVWKTIWFIFKSRYYGRGDILNLFFFRPYPGSVLFDRLLREKKIQLNNDDYFVDSIFIVDAITTHQYYNENISPFWYRVYQVIALTVFYGMAYLKSFTLKNYAHVIPK